SRRRSILRLRAARRWRMVLFTRNPPGEACLTGQQLIKHRRNTEGFRVFPEIYSSGAGNLAFFRTSGPTGVPRFSPRRGAGRRRNRGAESLRALSGVADRGYRGSPLPPPLRGGGSDPHRPHPGRAAGLSVRVLRPTQGGALAEGP